MRFISLTTVRRGSVVALIAASAIVPSIAFSAPASIYAGQNKEQAGITLITMGSGSTVETSTEKLYSGGGRSIKVTTQGMYSGGGIEFATPIDLNVGDPASKEYLQFVTTFNQNITLTPTGYTYGQAYMGSDYGSDSDDLIRMPKVSKIRVVLVSDTGKSAEVQQPVVSTENDEGWPRINIPLAAVKSPDGEKTMKVKKVLFFTDIPDSFYIGEINTLTDSSPLTCDAGEEQVVRANEVVLFHGTAEGGASTLLYSWDFDDKDGIQEDAGGPVTVHLYKKPGTYTVTLTVRDFHNLKPAVTSKVSIEVND